MSFLFIFSLTLFLTLLSSFVARLSLSNTVSLKNKYCKTAIYLVSSIIISLSMTGLGFLLNNFGLFNNSDSILSFVALISILIGFIASYKVNIKRIDEILKYDKEFQNLLKEDTSDNL